MNHLPPVNSISIAAGSIDDTMNSDSTVYTWDGTAKSLWTITNTGTSPDTLSINQNYQSSKIKLEGEDADIEVNGCSLTKTLDAIQQRLAILEPKPELEQRWQKLKSLGDEYRRLAAELEQGEQVWDILKK